MEIIHVPQYTDLKHRLASCVDRFYDVSLELMYTLRQQSTEQNTSPKLNFILKKIIKENDIENNGLMRLISTCTLEFAKFAVDTEDKDTIMKIRQEMKPTETLDKNEKRELKEHIDNIEKLKKLHMDVMNSLIKKQKNIWKLNQKKDLSVKTEDKAKTVYLNLIETEEKIRKELKQTTETIQNDLQEKMINRLSDAFDILRCLVGDFISNERSAYLLSVINNISISAVTKEIMESGCKLYIYTVPSEYFGVHDYDRLLLRAPLIMDIDPSLVLIDLDEDKDIKLYMEQLKSFPKRKSGLTRFLSSLIGKKSWKNPEKSKSVKTNADKYKQIDFN